MKLAWPPYPVTLWIWRAHRWPKLCGTSPTIPTCNAATLGEALATVEDAAPVEAIFITGSLFLVEEALALLGGFREVY